jgi:hypothetical protein
MLTTPCKLIHRNVFDFILGFSGISVLPRAVIPCIIPFLLKVFLARDNVLQSLTTTFTGNTRVGILTNMNLLHRDNGKIRSQQLVYSNFNMRIWGLEPRCPNPACSNLPYNIKFKARRTDRGDGNHDFVKCKCVQCGWESGYIGRPKWLMALPTPFWFVSDFPLIREQRETFTRQMVPMDRSPGV